MCLNRKVLAEPRVLQAQQVAIADQLEAHSRRQPAS
jgi:hypothetical protein